jgi:hypothetical protein
LTAIIKGKSKPYKKENEFFWQMYEMANDFRKFMPPFWMDRFAHSMALYFEGMAEEAPFKATLQFPSIEQYMAIRWKSVDVLQMIDGLEVATEMPLPDAVRHHPHMEQIAWLTCRIIAWCNDYFSAAKEQGLDVMNLILICQHQYHLSLDAAVQEAVRLHNEDVNTYLELCQSLPDHLKDDPAVQKFLSYNNYMIAGHWRWYITDTQRYRPGGYPTDQFHQNK